MTTINLSDDQLGDLMGVVRMAADKLRGSEFEKKYEDLFLSLARARVRDAKGVGPDVGEPLPSFEQTREACRIAAASECKFGCGDCGACNAAAFIAELSPEACLGKHVEPWLDDRVQFARLLAEIRAAGLNDEQFDLLSESMDLDRERVLELFDRAERAWEKAKPDANVSRRTSQEDVPVAVDRPTGTGLDRSDSDTRVVNLVVLTIWHDGHGLQFHAGSPSEFADEIGGHVIKRFWFNGPIVREE